MLCCCCCCWHSVITRLLERFPVELFARELLKVFGKSFCGVFVIGLPLYTACTSDSQDVPLQIMHLSCDIQVHSWNNLLDPSIWFLTNTFGNCRTQSTIEILIHFSGFHVTLNVQCDKSLGLAHSVSLFSLSLSLAPPRTSSIYKQRPWMLQPFKASLWSQTSYLNMI